MSDNVIIDEGGNNIWLDPQGRLSDIERVLKPKLEDLAMRLARNEQKMYPAKLNFIPTITNYADPYLRKAPLVRYDYAIQVDEEMLEDYKNAWFDLMIFIREYVPDYIANKQLFCAFMCISVSAFNYLQTSSNGNIVAIIESLLDSFEDTNMTSAQGGAVNSNATFNRMRAKDSGYNMQLKADEQNNDANKIVIIDNDKIKRQLANMFGGKLDKPKK